MAHVDQAPDGKPMLTVSDADDLLQWLETRKDRRDGTWLVRGRRGSQHPRLEYEDVIRVLLTVGWVDAPMRMLDEGRSLLWISPRRRGSVWSRPNKLRVARLEAEGRMLASGLAAIERAKADGSWSVLDWPENLEVPDDLAEGLAAAPGARANFDAFPPSARKAYLGSIAMAKTEATRRRRIESTVERAEANLRPGA